MKPADHFGATIAPWTELLSFFVVFFLTRLELLLAPKECLLSSLFSDTGFFQSFHYNTFSTCMPYLKKKIPHRNSSRFLPMVQFSHGNIKWEIPEINNL
jgi:hypothetical protein